MKKLILLILLTPLLANAYVFDFGLQLNETSNFANVQGVSNSRAFGFGFGPGIYSLFPISNSFKAGISIQYTGYNYAFSDVILANTTAYYQLHTSALTTELLTTYSLPPQTSFVPEIIGGLMINYGISGKYFTNISGGRTTTITTLTNDDLNTDLLLHIGFMMTYKKEAFGNTVHISPAVNFIYNMTGSGSHIGYINLNYSPNLTIMLNINISTPLEITND